MGQLVNGEWQDRWYDTSKTGGAFVRKDAGFRDWVTPDGTPGPGGRNGFAAEADKYHLYVSLACPWAHRAIIFRRLKGLENLIGMTVVHPHMLENGWEFARDGDPLYGYSRVHQLYTKAVPDYTGRVTVPILWDKETQTIVNNESSEIIRMFNCAFNGLTGNNDDYYPHELRAEIDRMNDRIYHTVNNGVYRAGFATSQNAYEQAFNELFETLELLEAHLAHNRYLVGGKLTEADIRLFTTLIRFDAIYYGHFKTNLKRVADYPNLSAYVRDLYQQPGIGETVDFDHIKQHYYVSQTTINPTQVVPLGPDQDFSQPHNRARLG